jgi:hypothetical protein
VSWVFTCQDYSRHQFGDPRPPIERQYFATGAEAETAFRAYQRGHPDRSIHVASVTKTKRRKPPVAEQQIDFGFAMADGPRRLAD